MSRFIIKHLRWNTAKWGEVGTPYDYGCSKPEVYTRITDPNLPRVGEFFTDENGITYLHAYKNGMHAYIKSKVDGAKNVFSERSYDADFIQERKSLGVIKETSGIKSISTLENEYVATLSTVDNTDVVKFYDYKSFFLSNANEVSLGGTQNYTLELTGTAKDIYLCRTKLGLTLFVHFSDNTVKIFYYDIILDSETSAFNPEGVGLIEYNLETNIPKSDVRYITQLSEDGHFLFFLGNEIAEINISPSESGDISAAASTAINYAAQPCVKSLSKAWQKEYTHRNTRLPNGDKRVFAIPVAVGASGAKALVYMEGWTIKPLPESFPNVSSPAVTVTGLSKLVADNISSGTLAYEYNLSAFQVCSKNLGSSDILIDDSDYQYSRNSGSLFEDRCSFSALKADSGSYKVRNITIANGKANTSKLERSVFEGFTGVVSNSIFYLGNGYFFILGTGNTGLIANTGFITSTENINVEEINAEHISVRNNESSHDDGVDIDYKSLNLKNGNNEIFLDVGKDTKDSEDKVSFGAKNSRYAVSKTDITETASKKEIIESSEIFGKASVETKVTSETNGDDVIREEKRVSSGIANRDTKIYEAVAKTGASEGKYASNNRNTSRISESVSSDDGENSEGKVFHELAKRRNEDIEQRNVGSFVREEIQSGQVLLERAENLGENTYPDRNVHETIAMTLVRGGQDEPDKHNYTRTLEAKEGTVKETITTETNIETVTTGAIERNDHQSNNQYSHNVSRGKEVIEDVIVPSETHRTTQFDENKHVKEIATNTESKVEARNNSAIVEIKAKGANGSENDLDMHLPDSNTREVVDRAGNIKTAGGTTVTSDPYASYKIYMRNKTTGCTYETSIESLENYIKRIRADRRVSNANGLLLDDPNYGWIESVGSSLSNKFIKLIEIVLPVTNGTQYSTLNFDLLMSGRGVKHKANVTLTMACTSGNVSSSSLVCSGISGAGGNTLFRSLLDPGFYTDGQSHNFLFYPYAAKQSGKFKLGFAIKVGTISSTSYPTLGIKFNHVTDGEYESLRVINVLDSTGYHLPSDIFKDFKFDVSTHNYAVSSLPSDLTQVQIERYSDGSDVFGDSGIGRHEENGKVKPIWITGNGIPTELPEVYTSAKVDADFIKKSLFNGKGYLVVGTGSGQYTGLAPKNTSDEYYLSEKGRTVEWKKVTFAQDDEVVKKSMANNEHDAFIVGRNDAWYGIGPSPSMNDNEYYFLGATRNTAGTTLFSWKAFNSFAKNCGYIGNTTPKGALLGIYYNNGDNERRNEVRPLGPPANSQPWALMVRYYAPSAGSADQSGTMTYEYRDLSVYALKTDLDTRVNKITNSTNGKSATVDNNGGVTLTSDFFLDRKRGGPAPDRDTVIGKIVFRASDASDSKPSYVLFYSGYIIIMHFGVGSTTCGTADSDGYYNTYDLINRVYTILTTGKSNIVSGTFSAKIFGESATTDLNNFVFDDFLKKVVRYGSRTDIETDYGTHRFVMNPYAYRDYDIDQTTSGSTWADEDTPRHYEVRNFGQMVVLVLMNRDINNDNVPVHPWTSLSAKLKFNTDLHGAGARLNCNYGVYQLGKYVSDVSDDGKQFTMNPNVLKRIFTLQEASPFEFKRGAYKSKNSSGTGDSYWWVRFDTTFNIIESSYDIPQWFPHWSFESEDPPGDGGWRMSDSGSWF